MPLHYLKYLHFVINKNIELCPHHALRQTFKISRSVTFTKSFIPTWINHNMVVQELRWRMWRYITAYVCPFYHTTRFQKRVSSTGCIGYSIRPRYSPGTCYLMKKLLCYSLTRYCHSLDGNILFVGHEAQHWEDGKTRYKAGAAV